MARGSGLDTEQARRVLAAGDRDAAIALCSTALEDNPDDVAALRLLGRLRAATGEAAQAERLARRAAELAPDSPDSHYTLALALDAGGRRREALKSLVQALERDPDHAPACAAAGRLLAAAGRLDQAIESLEHALSLDPAAAAPRRDLVNVLSTVARGHAGAGRARMAADCLARAAGLSGDDAATQLRLGVALQRLGDLARAEDCYRRAVALEPADADAHSNLGTLAQARRTPDIALDHYRRALEIAPGHADATAGVAAVLDWQGRYEEAMAMVRARIDAGDRGIELMIMYGKLARRTGERLPALALLLPQAGALGERTSARQRLSFVVADLLEDEGRYPEAFDWYSRGNRLKAARFDRSGHAAAVDALIETGSREHLVAGAVNPVMDERPVFVVGMPRSGTSLVEQILAAHPSVYAGGEMTTMSELVVAIESLTGEAYPGALARLGEKALSQLAGRYLAAFGAVGPGIVRLTDKMPNNFLHLGLIQRMLPGARIVHCRRDARDVALSNFFQNFTGDTMPFAYDLADLGHYCAGYRRLMAHYARVIDLPVLHVDYETLVAQPQAGIRRLLDFLDLPFDAACLDFHRLERVATTASHAQVRRPVYTDSVYRHRRHAAALAPFLDALGPPWADELGELP